MKIVPESTFQVYIKPNNGEIFLIRGLVRILYWINCSIAPCLPSRIFPLVRHLQDTSHWQSCIPWPWPSPWGSSPGPAWRPCCPPCPGFNIIREIQKENRPFLVLFGSKRHFRTIIAPFPYTIFDPVPLRVAGDLEFTPSHVKWIFLIVDWTFKDDFRLWGKHDFWSWFIDQKTEFLDWFNSPTCLLFLYLTTLHALDLSKTFIPLNDMRL